jgi:putative Holliday junction resolvase
MKNGYVLAFDFGLRNIGVAVGQSITRTASPLITIKASNGTPNWDDLTALINEWQPTTLAVGLPLNMDDSESEMSGLARKFAKRLGRRFGLSVELVDERLTTFAAQRMDPDRAHEVAAVLIAQTWLNES